MKNYTRKEDILKEIERIEEELSNIGSQWEDNDETVEEVSDTQKGDYVIGKLILQNESHRYENVSFTDTMIENIGGAILASDISADDILEFLKNPSIYLERNGVSAVDISDGFVCEMEEYFYVDCYEKWYPNDL